MPNLYDHATPLTPYGAINAGVAPPDVFGVAINWFTNRTPLTSRLRKRPVGSQSFLFTNSAFRPRGAKLDNGGNLTNVATSFVVDDASIFDVDDVLKLEDEYLLVQQVDPATNTLTVKRGHAGTSAVAHNDALPFHLITNTRTGAAVDIGAASRKPSAFTQWCQTVQHAYSVGGSLQTTQNYVSGEGTPLDRDRMIAAQHCMDDFESAIYYGKKVAISAADSRPQMEGFDNLLITNRTKSPTNASSYKSTDLIRDTIQRCFDGGGNPTHLLVSTDFLSGFAVWGHAAMRVNAGETVFGTPIDLFEAPFLSGVLVIPAPLLRPGTAICISEPECKVRIKRPLVDKPRGSRGDAVEGDFIMEGAIEIDNEAHHAMVSGITAFAAS